jgi:hypothetical protein
VSIESSPAGTGTATITTATATGSATVIPTGTPAATPSTSATPTQTPHSTGTASATASLAALRVQLASVSAGAGPLQLSDSLPPLAFSLSFSPCDATFVGGALVCAATAQNGGAGVAVLLSSPASLKRCSGADSVAVAVQFGSEAGWSSVACSAMVDGESYASNPVRVPVQRTLWPLFQDLLVVLEDGRLKSAWAPPVNGTAVMLAAGFNGSAASDLEKQVLHLVEAIDYSATLQTGTALDVLLSGGSTLVLVADRTFWADRAAAPGYAGFTNESAVWIGDVPCSVEWVSDDGSLLAFAAPSLDAVCPDAATSSTGDCGYAALRIQNGDLSEVDALGAGISCPPFCPGLFPGSVPFESDSSLVPAAPQANELPLPVAQSALQFASAGLYYTASCVASGFTDPTSGACTNVSDPAFSKCAFGVGDGCKPCPAGAMCPGGNRAWPLPGYYTASEDSGTVTACTAPATTRCTGWNSSMGSAACGRGYRSGSYGCLVCDTDFYADTTGACVSCPAAEGVWPVLQPLLIFVGAVLAVAMLLYGALLLIAKAFGGSLAGGVSRMVQFITWTITVVQVQSHLCCFRGI